MGSELYRMIRDGAPPGWTPPMVLVASMIADDARDPSRREDDEGWPWSALPVEGYWTSAGKWRDGLTERTRMKARAIRRELTALAAAGYEMREPVGKGKDGRMVFTAPGRAMRFRVPPLPPRPAPERSPDTATDAPNGDQNPATDAEATVTRFGGNGDQIPHERSPESGHPISPDPPNSPPTAKSSAVNSSVEGSQRAREQDQDFSGNEQEPRPASPDRAGPPETPAEAAFKIIRPFTRGNGISVTDAGELARQAADMLTNGSDAGRIRAALPAWLKSGKPPGALPEFVEAETAP
jgi:hypothetical protein